MLEPRGILCLNQEKSPKCIKGFHLEFRKRTTHEHILVTRNLEMLRVAHKLKVKLSEINARWYIVEHAECTVECDDNIHAPAGVSSAGV